MEINGEKEVKNEIIISDEKKEQENIEQNDVNKNMKKISQNNDLEDEGKDIELTGQILFRRTMGKKLCSVTLLNDKEDSTIGVSIHDPEIKNKKSKVNHNLIYVKGRVYYHKNNPQNKNIQAEIVKILGKGPDAERINNKRKFFF